MVTKINMSRKKPINLEKDQIYYRKVVERTTVRKSRAFSIKTEDP